MNETDNDVQVLFKKDGKYYTLEPKPSISPETAKEKRLLIFNLFKDHHILKEVVINKFEWTK